MGKIYIHYGHKHFEPNSFVEIKNTMWNKPYGGLWLQILMQNMAGKVGVKMKIFVSVIKKIAFVSS